MIDIPFSKGLKGVSSYAYMAVESSNETNLIFLFLEVRSKEILDRGMFLIINYAYSQVQNEVGLIFPKARKDYDANCKVFNNYQLCSKSN